MNRVTLVIGLFFSLAGGILLVIGGDTSGWWVLGFFGFGSAVVAIPLLPKRWFLNTAPNSLIGHLRGEVQIPDPRCGVLAPDAIGLRHTLPEGVTVFIPWDQVDQIMTFNVDLLTTDCICVLFAGRFPESPHQIHEEMIGFGEIFVPLRTAFPALSESWFIDVMTPAFETKATVLFDRNAAVDRVVGGR